MQITNSMFFLYLFVFLRKYLGQACFDFRHPSYSLIVVSRTNESWNWFLILLLKRLRRRRIRILPNLVPSFFLIFLPSRVREEGGGWKTLGTKLNYPCQCNLWSSQAIWSIYSIRQLCMAVVAGQQHLKLTKWVWPAVHQVWLIFFIFVLWLLLLLLQ